MPVKNGKKDLKAKSGDYVEVSLVKKDYQGTLLEVPKDEKGIILLKLNSGYNLGFKKKDILDVKVLKKAEEKAKYCNGYYRRNDFCQIKS
jgi:hypothetical protein